MANLVLEKRGRTIHLLKKASKAVPQGRKRRKIALAAMPEEFAKEKSPPAAHSQPMQIDQVASEDKEDKASATKRTRVKTGYN